MCSLENMTGLEPVMQPAFFPPPVDRRLLSLLGLLAIRQRPGQLHLVVSVLMGL
jgi:hypothetical protein